MFNGRMLEFASKGREKTIFQVSHMKPFLWESHAF